MNNTNKSLENAKMNLSLGHSRHGVPQPQVEVRFAKGTNPRVVRAALLTLAAEIELSTPSLERWTVQINDDADERGWVYLELEKGSEGEAKKGMEVLGKVVR